VVDTTDRCIWIGCKRGITEFKLKRFQTQVDERNQRHRRHCPGSETLFWEFSKTGCLVAMNRHSSLWLEIQTRNSFHFSAKLSITRAFTVAMILCSAVAAAAQVTFTGTQAAVASGTWSSPSMVAVDTTGNVYVADSVSNQVFELAKTSAGLSQPVVIDSNLSAPMGVAADSHGNVYISDSGNSRILMMPRTTAGLGSPVQIAAGLSGPGGLAVDLAGNVFVADTGNNRVVEIPLAGSAYGTPVALATGLSAPRDVALDSAKSLFIADTGNHRVLKQTLTSGVYSAPVVVAGGMTPTSVYVDRSNDLFVGDAVSGRVLEKTWASWANRYNVNYFLGSNLTSPAGVAVDASGDVYIADSGGQVVQIDFQGLSFAAVNVGATGSPVSYNFTINAGTTIGNVGILMQGVAGKDFADAGGSSCIAQTYAVATYCGVNVKFSPISSGVRQGAINLFDGLGNMLVTTFLSGTGVNAQAAYFPGTVTLLGTGLSGPSGVAVDGVGNVYIADSGNDRVVMLPWTGSGFGPQVTLPIPGLSNPLGMAIDGAGNLFIASNGNDRVVKLPKTPTGFGTPSKVGVSLYGPMGVTVDRSGAVYIADTLNTHVDKLVWTGVAYAAETGIGSYHRSPIGIAVDGSGNVYFSDPYAGQVGNVPWSGTTYMVQSYITPMQKDFYAALAVDGNSNLYVLDATTNSVVMLPTTGSGFGPLQTVARGFNAPAGMTLDSNGVLYIADTGNNQIVRVDFSAPQPVTFSATNVGSVSSDGTRMTVMQNLGNEPIQLTLATYPADFPEAAGTSAPCLEDTTLGQNQWCQIAVSFLPNSVGSPLTESIQMAGNLTGSSPSTQSLTVSGTSLPRQSQTISFPPVPQVVYGSAPLSLLATATSGLPATFTVVSGPALLSSSGHTVQFTGVGTVVVQANQVGNSTFLPAAAVNMSIQVTRGVLTVTPNNKSAFYGAIPATFAYTITGFAAGDTVANSVMGQAVIGSHVQPNSGAGTYALTVSQGTLSATNYSFLFSTGTLTVRKAYLHVFPTSMQRAYGAAMPNFAWTLNGFFNGDASGVVTGSPAITTTATASSPVGSYPITATAGTLAAANYVFDIRAATLTVTAAALTVTATNQSISYGAAIPGLVYTISGFANGDSAANATHGAPVVSTTATSQSNAGSYMIGAALGSLTSSNYSFRFVSGTLTVNKAVVSVAPVNATMIYGAPLPTFTFVFSGWVNGDSASTAIAGLPGVSTLAGSKAKPGSNQIAAVMGTMTSKNYSFVFGTATLQIGKAMLTVTPSPAAMIYGGSLPKLAYQLMGFNPGDGASAVTGAPSLTTTATAQSSVGSYLIAVTVGTLTSDLYDFQVVAGTLTVAPAVLKIAAANVAMNYGGALPTLSYTITGFIAGDTQSAVVTGTPQLTTSAKAGSSVANYAISLTSGSLAAKNYTFQLGGGTLVVNKAPLSIVADNQSMKTRSKLPALTYTAKGLVNGDTLTTATTGAPLLSTTATSSSSAGTYAITVAAGTLAANNYQLSYSNGKLTVTQ
jgi:sugar lactone lactonase YvrE